MSVRQSTIPAQYMYARILRQEGELAVQADCDPETGTWSQTTTVPVTVPESADHTIRFGAAVP